MIGRVGWDSFVTQWALDSGIEVIDASQFLHAAHLTGADGNNAVRASNLHGSRCFLNLLALAKFDRGVCERHVCARACVFVCVCVCICLCECE